MPSPFVRLHTLALTALLAAAAGACASRGGGSAPDAGEDSQSRAAAARPDIITAQEIAAATTATNAYDLVQQLRPQLLTPRGVTSMGGSMSGPATPTVYLDRAKLGGIETLRSVALQDIVEIRYFNSTMAATRFGPDERAGVILLTSRK